MLSEIRFPTLLKQSKLKVHVEVCSIFAAWQSHPGINVFGFAVTINHEAAAWATVDFITPTGEIGF